MTVPFWMGTKRWLRPWKKAAKSEVLLVGDVPFIEEVPLVEVSFEEADELALKVNVTFEPGSP